MKRFRTPAIHVAYLALSVLLFGTDCPAVRPTRPYVEPLVPCDASTQCPASQGDAGVEECVMVPDPRVRGICAPRCSPSLGERFEHRCVGWTGNAFAEGAPSYHLPVVIDSETSVYIDATPIYAYDLPAAVRSSS